LALLITAVTLGADAGATVHPDAGLPIRVTARASQASPPDQFQLHRSGDGYDLVPAAAQAALPASVAASAARGTSGDHSAKRPVRRRPQTTVDPRLADLAATRGEVASVAHLRGAAPIEPAGSMAATAEHRIRVHDPDKPPGRSQMARLALAAPATTLDPGMVKEISRRKVLFRLCAESARRRGVAATRADVKWILAADGRVHDVEVAVAQDAQLANCIRVVASRPFPKRVEQDMVVAIPLLFVGAR